MKKHLPLLIPAIPETKGIQKNLHASYKGKLVIFDRLIKRKKRENKSAG